MRSNHRSDTVLLSNGSRISKSSLEIFFQHREVILSEKDLCVCYTAKKVAYRSFPQWEIMAFVTFRSEEFAFALQEKYNRISCKASWSCTSTFVDLTCPFFHKFPKCRTAVFSIAPEIVRVVGLAGLLSGPVRPIFYKNFQKTASSH